MNTQKYGQKIAELIELVFEQKNSNSEAVFRTLSRLMKAAKENGDYTLLGFTHFHLADALYTFEKSYTKFRENLARAIYFFQLGDDAELLARAYNYVSVDALNNGSFDVAYLYLMNALHTCENLDNNYLLSIINNNIGQVYARMKNYKKALKYVRLGNKLQALSPKDDYYYHQNMINGYFSEGILCCLLEDLAGADRADRKIAKLEQERDMSDIPSVFIPISLLRLMISVMKGDADGYETHSRYIVEKIRGAHRLFDFITDVEDLCRFLIERGYTDTARSILDIVTNDIASSGVVQMQKTLSSLEIAYCEKIGDEKALARQLREQYRLTELMQMEQNRIYQYSIDLINIMRKQQKEQEKIQQENKSLHTQVHTDPLTGIPNRLKLDQSIGELFSNAKKKKNLFGVSLMDINRFKEYNDSYGHLAGDLCLQKVARAIESVSNRPGVHCARYGGDEFVMLYENKSDEEILSIARELEKQIYALNILHSGDEIRGRVSLSQGICNCVPSDLNTAEDYLAEADNSLYAVKKNLHRVGQTEQIRLVQLPY